MSPSHEHHQLIHDEARPSHHSHHAQMVADFRRRFWNRAREAGSGIPLPHDDSIEMLVPVEHFMGSTVYHCHIVEHEDVGMIGIWELA